MDEKLQVSSVICDLERVGGVALRDERLAALGLWLLVEAGLDDQGERSREIELVALLHHRGTAEQPLGRSSEPNKRTGSLFAERSSTSVISCF